MMRALATMTGYCETLIPVAHGYHRVVPSPCPGQFVLSKGGAVKQLGASQDGFR